jgi:hypothetical protein
MDELYRSVAGLVTGGEHRALRAEALRLRDGADTMDRHDYHLVDDVQLLSPAHSGFTAVGDARRALHAGALADRIPAVLGHPVRAELSSYLYYERGDFVGLHVDQRTVLVLLDGDAGPLFVHPELSGLPAAELLRHSRRYAGHPPSGTAVALRAGPLLLRGGRIPHHRPPHDRDGVIALAAFCYFFDAAG